MFKRATPTSFDSNEVATDDLLAGKVDAQVSNSAPQFTRRVTIRVSRR
jgi:hypothetical protein